jgi:hypothetical protein
MQPWGGYGKQRTQALGQLQWFSDFVNMGWTSGEDFHAAPLAKNSSSQRGTLVASQRLVRSPETHPRCLCPVWRRRCRFPSLQGSQNVAGATDRAVLDEQVPPRGWYLHAALRHLHRQTDPTGHGQQTHGARRLELRVRASSMQRQDAK